MLNCRVCGSELIEILRYDNMPRGAQIFPTKEELQDDYGITLIITQCVSCGLVQLANNPVDYYAEAARTKFWMNSEWRKKQIEDFIKEFMLEGKKVKVINSEPVLDKYDAFLMFNYLEHLPDPIQSLRNIRDSLSFPGVGIVEVPNLYNIVTEDVFSEFVIDHLFYFDERTLKYTLQTGGFDVISFETKADEFILSAKVIKRIPYEFSFFKFKEQILRGDIYHFIKDFKKIAVWGAGHQGLMMLELMDIKDKVAYVVDSAIKKQSKYTPVTHIPIVAPSRLQEESVDAILIFVGGFTEGVIKQIKELHLLPKPKVASVAKSRLQRIRI